MQTNPTHPAALKAQTPQPWKLAGGLLALLVLLAGLALLSSRTNFLGPPGGPEGPLATPKPDPQTTRCEIDPSDTTPPKNQVVPWEEGQTVFDQLCLVAEVRATGEGYFTFVDSVDGTQNEGAEGRNWQFWLNGHRSDEGAGAIELRPGDSVLWRFAGTE